MLRKCEPARIKLAGCTSHPAHRANMVEYVIITRVIGSEITCVWGKGEGCELVEWVIVTRVIGSEI